jgi:elongation factor G
MGMDNRPDGRQLITAEVPQAEMLTYARDLRSITGGRANFHAEHARHEEVPQNLVEKVLAANEQPAGQLVG